MRDLASDVMEEMDPELLQFIKEHVVTFIRWDLIRFFHENPYTWDTAENLARYIGRASEEIQAEARQMATEGLLRQTTLRGQTIYALTDDPHWLRLISALVEATREQTFRMKLVYHILRAISTIFG